MLSPTLEGVSHLDYGRQRVDTSTVTLEYRQMRSCRAALALTATILWSIVSASTRQNFTEVLVRHNGSIPVFFNTTIMNRTHFPFAAVNKKTGSRPPSHSDQPSLVKTTVFRISETVEDGGLGKFNNLEVDDRQRLSTTESLTETRESTLKAGAEKTTTTTMTAIQAEGEGTLNSEADSSFNEHLSPLQSTDSVQLASGISDSTISDSFTLVPQGQDTISLLDVKNVGVASTTTHTQNQVLSSSTSSRIDVASRASALPGDHATKVTLPHGFRDRSPKYANISSRTTHRGAVLKATGVAMGHLVLSDVMSSTKVSVLSVSALESSEESASSLTGTSDRPLALSQGLDPLNDDYFPTDVTATTSQYTWQSRSVGLADDGIAVSMTFHPIDRSLLEATTRSDSKLSSMKLERPMSTQSKPLSDLIPEETVISAPQIINEGSFPSTAVDNLNSVGAATSEDEPRGQLRKVSSSQQPFQKTTRAESEAPLHSSSASPTSSSAFTVVVVGNGGLLSSAKPGIYAMFPRSTMSRTWHRTSTFATRDASVPTLTVEETAHVGDGNRHISTRFIHSRSIGAQADTDSKESASRSSHHHTASRDLKDPEIRLHRATAKDLETFERLEMEQRGWWKKLIGKKPKKYELSRTTTTATSKSCIPSASVTPLFGITIRDPSKLNYGILYQDSVSPNLNVVSADRANRTGTVFEIGRKLDGIYCNNGLRQFGYDAKRTSEGTPLVIVDAGCSDLKTTGFSVDFKAKTIVAPEFLIFYLRAPDYSIGLINPRFMQPPTERWWMGPPGFRTAKELALTEGHFRNRVMPYDNITVLDDSDD